MGFWDYTGEWGVYLRPSKYRMICPKNSQVLKSELRPAGSLHRPELHYKEHVPCPFSGFIMENSKPPRGSRDTTNQS